MKEFFQHAATTDGVTVRVAVNYLPEQSHPEAGKWFWVYHIRIENASHEPLRLRTRHWRITGQSHDYVSGCPLTTPFGSMEGFYTFQRPDGSPFEVRIPFFPLSAPETAEGRSPR
jgi:ApaG protein